MKVIKTYRNIILPVVLYRCETYRLEMFENKVLRRIFGPKMDNSGVGKTT